MLAKGTAISAFNTASMVAFALPGGQTFGAALIIADFILGMCPDSTVPSSPVTEADLVKAVADTKANIAQALWDDHIDDTTVGIAPLKTQFDSLWADVHQLGYDRQSSTITSVDDTFVPHVDGYFNLLDQDAIANKLEAYRLSLEIPKQTAAAALTPLQILEHHTKTTGLYCLIASLHVAYLKAAVTWRWGFILAKNIRRDEYDKEIADWTAEAQDPYTGPAFVAANPRSDIDKKYSDLFDAHNQLYNSVKWENFAKVSPVRELKDTVQRILDYCLGTGGNDGLYVSMKKNWDAMELMVAGYEGISFDPASPLNGVGAFVNPGNALLITARQMKAAFQKCLPRGKAWGDFENDHGLTGVVEDDLTKFKETIDAWRTTMASVQFKNYVVQPKDTFLSIAKGDAALAAQILDTNRDVCPDSTSIKDGMTLRIYDPDAMPFAPRPKPGTLVAN